MIFKEEKNKRDTHCVKSAHIRSYSDPYFRAFRQAEAENIDQNKSEYGLFFTQ